MQKNNFIYFIADIEKKELKEPDHIRCLPMGYISISAKPPATDL